MHGEKKGSNSPPVGESAPGSAASGPFSDCGSWKSCQWSISSLGSNLPGSGREEEQQTTADNRQKMLSSLRTQPFPRKEDLRRKVTEVGHSDPGVPCGRNCYDVRTGFRCSRIERRYRFT
ncbi:hypothetical protein Ccrd_003324 [Cynara cardunculus var. scolymus]|uniref:Uncharacterized protein n=1 Tax=Cynara cardunculus var. scolymus TaxID=59895 RepID=A0A118JVT9_CYNCS|nr:hypothetical protein Ccrd_003324 [Cynara cardunculus var. scolymus]